MYFDHILPPSSFQIYCHIPTQRTLPLPLPLLLPPLYLNLYFSLPNPSLKPIHWLTSTLGCGVYSWCVISVSEVTPLKKTDCAFPGSYLTQWLRVLGLFTEDPGLLPSTHIVAHNSRVTCGAHRYIQRKHSYTYNKNN